MRNGDVRERICLQWLIRKLVANKDAAVALVCRGELITNICGKVLGVCF